MKKVSLFLLFAFMGGSVFAWNLPGINLGGGKEAKESSSVSAETTGDLKTDDKVKEVMKNIKLTSDVINRFLEVYPRYVKIMDKCAPEEDPNSALAVQKCSKKLMSLLKKYKFSITDFTGVLTRLSYAYARAQMGDSPLGGMMSNMFSNGLTQSGQTKLTKEEIALVKKYMSKLEKIFGE